MSDLSIVLLAALTAGLAASAIRLPPLVGFLTAGFVLNAAGVPKIDGLDTLADLGVALLLFGIGLRLDLRVLARREVWLTSVVHMGASSLVTWAYLSMIAVVGAALMADQDWRSLLVVGFALSFSSTVLVVKVLDDQNSTLSRSGRTAVGILVIQDLVAVAFLTMATAKRRARGRSFSSCSSLGPGWHDGCFGACATASWCRCSAWRWHSAPATHCSSTSG